MLKRFQIANDLLYILMKICLSLAAYQVSYILDFQERFNPLLVGALLIIITPSIDYLILTFSRWRVLLFLLRFSCLGMVIFVPFYEKIFLVMYALLGLEKYRRKNFSDASNNKKELLMEQGISTIFILLLIVFIFLTKAFHYQRSSNWISGMCIIYLIVYYVKLYVKNQTDFLDINKNAKNIPVRKMVGTSIYGLYIVMFTAILVWLLGLGVNHIVSQNTPDIHFSRPILFHNTEDPTDEMALEEPVDYALPNYEDLPVNNFKYGLLFQTILLVVTGLALLYGLFSVLKKYFRLPKRDYSDISFNEINDLEEQLLPEKYFKSSKIATNNELARKVYKHLIKAVSKVQHKKINPHETPSEIQSKFDEASLDVATIIYEHARYSNEALSDEEIKPLMHLKSKKWKAKKEL